MGSYPVRDAKNATEIAQKIQPATEAPTKIPMRTPHVEPKNLTKKSLITQLRNIRTELGENGPLAIPDHKDLDRHGIKEILAELATADCRPSGGAGSRSERLAALRQRCDSATL